MSFIVPIIIVFSVVIGVAVPIAFVVLLMKKLGGQQKENDRILQTGMPAQARVLQLQHTGASVSFGAHRHLKLIIAMEVHVQGGQPYQVQAEQLISELLLPSIQPGAWLQVRVDPANPHKVAIAGGGSPPGAAPPGPAPAYGMPAAFGPGAGGWVAPNVGATMNKAFSRAMIMTLVMTFGIGALVAIPLLAVFVDWSAFGLGSGGDGSPAGGYCKALVRCCKAAHGTAGNCDQWAGLPAAGCQSAYESYKQSAQATGKSCD
jgi:hypothetical protein